MSNKMSKNWKQLTVNADKATIVSSDRANKIMVVKETSVLRKNWNDAGGKQKVTTRWYSIQSIADYDNLHSELVAQPTAFDMVRIVDFYGVILKEE